MICTPVPPAWDTLMACWTTMMSASSCIVWRFARLIFTLWPFTVTIWIGTGSAPVTTRAWRVVSGAVSKCVKLATIISYNCSLFFDTERHYLCWEWGVYMKFVNAAAWIDPEHASMCFIAHGVIPVKPDTHHIRVEVLKFDGLGRWGDLILYLSSANPSMTFECVSMLVRLLTSTFSLFLSVALYLHTRITPFSPNQADVMKLARVSVFLGNSNLCCWQANRVHEHRWDPVRLFSVYPIKYVCVYGQYCLLILS